MIRLRNVFKRYGLGRDALRDINFRMEQAEFVVLTGPTGSGKSTFLGLVLMEYLPTEGEVSVRGLNARRATGARVARLRRGIGVIPQHAKLLDDRSVFENVALAHRLQFRQGGRPARRVMRALTEVGIAHKRGAMPGELSGGEQQLVAVARAIVADPWLLVADEPLAGLDPAAAARVVHLLWKLHVGGTAVLVAAHREEPWRRPGTRVMRIVRGQLEAAD